MQLISACLFLLLTMTGPALGVPGESQPKAVAPARERDEVLALKPLKAPCQLTKRWVGSVFALPFGAWLNCGGLPVLIREPLNLLGHVDIKSSEEALHFVRLFSSSETHELFNLGGFVELQPNDEHWGQNIIRTLGLVKIYHEPVISEHSKSGICVDQLARNRECTKKAFTIRRIVIAYDQNVYSIKEQVDQDGFYSLISQEKLLDDVSKFGILHLGPH